MVRHRSLSLCYLCFTGVGGFMVRHRSSSKSTIGLSKESVNPLMSSELLEGQWSLNLIPSSLD